MADMYDTCKPFRCRSCGSKWRSVDSAESDSSLCVYCADEASWDSDEGPGTCGFYYGFCPPDCPHYGDSND